MVNSRNVSPGCGGLNMFIISVQWGIDKILIVKYFNKKFIVKVVRILALYSFDN